MYLHNASAFLLLMTIKPTKPKMPAIAIKPHSDRVGTFLVITQIFSTVFDSTVISNSSSKNEDSHGMEDNNSNDKEWIPD